MNIAKKIIKLIMISLIMINILSPKYILAAKLSDDIGGFEAEVTTDAGIRTNKIKVIINRLLGFLRVISALILVLILATTGYQYIVATPEIKGELKKKMLPVILGIILIFAAVSIAGFIIEVIGG